VLGILGPSGACEQCLHEASDDAFEPEGRRVAALDVETPRDLERVGYDVESERLVES
jgi:hypothetical protein